jgi:PST family polysaccharide transporter/lipopolysaccharide exporter
MAYRFSNAPATEVTHIISQVSFPAYSKVQDDLSKLREGFFRTLQVTTFVSFPMAVGILVVAPTFVRAFFGSKWLPMVAAMQILAVYGASRSFGATFGPLFQAVGRPDISTKLQVLNLVVLAVLIYPLTAQFGMTGTALAVLGVTIVTPVPIYLVMRTIEGSYRRLVRILSYPTIGSAVMGAVVWYVQSQLDLGIPMVELAVLVTLGAAVYALIILSADRWFGYGINSLLRTMKESVA